MSVLAIILIILVGILLLFLEFFVVPGITIAGIGGFILIAGAIFSAYHFHGTEVGHYTLVGTIVFFVVLVVVLLKTGTWNRVMLQKTIDSHVTDIKEENKIAPGDTGKTISRLNPMGKVMVNGIAVEASTHGTFVDPGAEVEVIKVERTKIIVKPKI